MIGTFLFKLFSYYSYTTKNQLGKHFNVCRNQDYCYVEMHKEDNKRRY